VKMLRGSRPKVSAIIPAFNEEETISDVVTETLKYVDEVVVVDDGSWDDTGGDGVKILRLIGSRGGDGYPLVFDYAVVGVLVGAGGVVPSLPISHP